MIDPLMMTLADTRTAFACCFSTIDCRYTFAGMGSSAALLTFSSLPLTFCTATVPLVGHDGPRETKTEHFKLIIQFYHRSTSSWRTSTVPLSCSRMYIDWCTFTLGIATVAQVMGTNITGVEPNRYAVDFLTVRAFAVLCISSSTRALRGYLDTCNRWSNAIVEYILHDYIFKLSRYSRIRRHAMRHQWFTCWNSKCKQQHTATNSTLISHI